MSYILIR